MAEGKGTYHIIVAATGANADCVHEALGLGPRWDWVLDNLHRNSTADRYVSYARDYAHTIVWLVSPDRDGSTRKVPSELFAIPNVELRYVRWDDARKMYVEADREIPTIVVSEYGYTKVDWDKFAKWVKVSIVPPAFTVPNVAASEWHGPFIYEAGDEPPLTPFGEAILRGTHPQKEAPVKIEVTADTPVRLITTPAGEWRLLVASRTLDIDEGDGCGLFKWFNDTYGKDAIRFADVWEACPNSEWLDSLASAVGFNILDHAAMHHRYAADEADSDAQLEREVDAARKANAARDAEIVRVYLRPYAVEPSDHA